MQRSITGATLAAFAEAPDILTARELEGLIRIDVKTIYSYVQRGLIPYVRFESNVRFLKHEILAWIESSTYRPKPRNGNGRNGR